MLFQGAVQKKDFFFCLKKLLRTGGFNGGESTDKGRVKMKKIAAMTAIVMMCSAPVFAANTNPAAAQGGGFNGPGSTPAQTGGFTGPGGGNTTVENAKSMRDDAWVTLRGNIVERLSDDVYTFKDASGTINVDIDHKRWNGVSVGPQDLVEIQGEVDKDWNSVEIDVKQVSKVSK
jgi:uncharacterized protein (TIGR00156 family)